MKFRWSPAAPRPLRAGAVASDAGISPLLAQCLLNRGHDDALDVARFLSPRLKSLADPFFLPGMDAAVRRLFQAHDRNESVVLFGDYDVDGVTSTALLMETLRGLGWRVDGYLPNRLGEGYGLTRGAVETCLKRFPARLLLAVDCGSTSVETISWLRENGVDTIILDHHQVADPPPAAVAMVNPHFEGSPAGPFTELCSVGLAFKLAHALVKRGREAGLSAAEGYDLRPLLDLVALGTIADLVPLTGENRILVTAGLERLNSTTRPGILALKEVAQSPESLNTQDVAYQLGPRLNAAGRLESADDSLRLLLAENIEEAIPLAQNLDARNRERQGIEKRIVEDVAGIVRARFDARKDFVIVEAGLPWHIGVVGIVATRILQEFYRPTIIIGGDNGEMRGSGRSIPGFDLAAALNECGDLLIRHGGHAMAAGLSVVPGKIDALRERLNAIAEKVLKPEDLQPPLRLDAEVQLAQINLESLAELERLKPMGQGNPAVQFYSGNLSLARPSQRMGAKNQHVKMWVTDGTVTHEAVWWNAAETPLPAGEFDLAFAPGINEFNGRKTVQLKVLDWRASNPRNA